jgi:Putative holin
VARRCLLVTSGARRASSALAGKSGVTVESVIPVPRTWLLTSAMLVGSAVGLVAGTAATVLMHGRIRPDVAMVLVVGVPSVIGLLMILLSRRRWITALGAFILALAPGWFGLLVLAEVMTPV